MVHWSKLGDLAMPSCQGSWKSLFQSAQLETQKKKGKAHIGGQQMACLKSSVDMRIQVKIKEASASQYNGLIIKPTDTA